MLYILLCFNQGSHIFTDSKGCIICKLYCLLLFSFFLKSTMRFFTACTIVLLAVKCQKCHSIFSFDFNFFVMIYSYIQAASLPSLFIHLVPVRDRLLSPIRSIPGLLQLHLLLRALFNSSEVFLDCFSTNYL